MIFLRAVIAFLALCCLFAGDGVSGFRWITQKLVDDDMLVETSGLRYAITSKMLLKNNWRCVSVDVNYIHIIRSDCSSFETKISELDEADKKLLAAARAEIHNTKHITGADRYYATGGAWRTVSAEYQYQGGQVVSNRRHENKVVGAFTVTIFGDDNFSIGGNQQNHLPGSFARVFFNYDIVTTVDNKSFVRMTPMACLKPQEAALFKDVHAKTQS